MKCSPAEKGKKMAKNDDLILRGKALKDLRAIKDMLVAAGDPFLAAVMNRPIDCIENQPKAAENIDTRVAELEAELALAMHYISEQRACGTCEQYDNALRECDNVCCDCQKEDCFCRTCDNGSKWKWRGSYGR